MKVITAPEPLQLETAERPRIFLAGSIEQDTASFWQDEVIRVLEAEMCTVYNPRRAAWDKTVIQSIDNPFFFEQVSWELDALEAARLSMSLSSSSSAASRLTT